MTPQNKINRRKFVIGAVGGTAAICGVSAVAAIQPPAIEYEEFDGTQNNDSTRKVLVAYTSQYGSTSGVATTIAQNLCESGIPADARLVNNVNEIAGYSAVIVGSPVISEQWMPEAMDFLETNRSRLKEIPVAYFLTCMTLAITDAQAPTQKMAGILDHVEAQFPEIKPVEKGLFAGALDFKKMSFVMQMMYRIFSEYDTAGDFRNWDAIIAWTKSLAPVLV